MDKAIEVKGLRKSFKVTEVLKGVDFEVKRGEIFALFGSNGAGKTAIAGLSAKSPEGAGAFSYPLIFLPFISSAFVQTESMPPVVRAFAENQSVPSIVVNKNIK